MIGETFLSVIAAAGTALVRATVIGVNDDGSVLVSAPDAPDTPFVCDRLITGADLAPLAPDDTVLCSLPSSANTRGVALGRVGASHAPVEPSADDGQQRGEAGTGRHGVA